MKKTLALFACAIALMLLPTVAHAETTEPSESNDQPIGVIVTLPEELSPYAYRLTDAYLVSRISLVMKKKQLRYGY